MRILLQGGTIINEGRTFKGDLLIHNDRIEKIIEGELDSVPGDIKVIDTTGKYIIPGVIDDQVHFREPGLTHKGDIREGSRAAAAGGVTSFMDMPRETTHRNQRITSGKTTDSQGERGCQLLVLPRCHR